MSNRYKFNVDDEKIEILKKGTIKDSVNTVLLIFERDIGKAV